MWSNTCNRNMIQKVPWGMIKKRVKCVRQTLGLSLEKGYRDDSPSWDPHHCRCVPMRVSARAHFAGEPTRHAQCTTCTEQVTTFPSTNPSAVITKIWLSRCLRNSWAKVFNYSNLFLSAWDCWAFGIIMFHRLYNNENVIFITLNYMLSYIPLA